MDASEIYVKHKNKEMKMMRFIGDIANWKSCMTLRKIVGYRINSNCYIVTEIYNSVSKFEVPKNEMIDTRTIIKLKICSLSNNFNFCILFTLV